MEMNEHFLYFVRQKNPPQYHLHLEYHTMIRISVQTHLKCLLEAATGHSRAAGENLHSFHSSSVMRVLADLCRPFIGGRLHESAGSPGRFHF